MDDSTARTTTRSARRLRWGTVAATALLTVVVGASCSDDDEAAEDEPAPTTANSTTTAPVTAAPICTDEALASRHVILCTSGNRLDQGLVVALHGRGSSAEEMLAGTALHEAAAAQGLATVYVDGLDGGWGDDTFPTPTRPRGDEDVAFLDDLVLVLQADPRIGNQPVGLVGFSNGASMALRYAAQRPDAVRGVVSVAGQLPRDPAIRPTARVPLLEVYGTADPVRPYDTGIADAASRQPGDPTPTLPTSDTVAAFVAVASGSVTTEDVVEADPDPADGTRLRSQRWTDDAGTLAVLLSVVDGGHTWPSSRAPFTGSERFGLVTHDVDAGPLAVAFLLDPDDTTLMGTGG